MSDSVVGGVQGTAGASVDPSELARGGALLRALAAGDEREEIRGRDTLAELFLADERKGSLDDPTIRSWLLKNYLPYGVYEYAIARTAYFDRLVEESLREKIPQIVFLGAGYDSRPYRFSSLLGETRLFELDDPHTQDRKRELLRRADIAIPERLVYAPLSYEKEEFLAILLKAGYDPQKQALFVWEGATYYLTDAQVEGTLGVIQANAKGGTTVCFDYNLRAQEAAGANAPDELKEMMTTPGSAEHLQFGVEQGQIGTFLAKRDYIIVEHLTAEEMERKFLTLTDGSPAGKVPARHCIVCAAVLG